MNNLQKTCIALGALGAAMLCVRVPYETGVIGASSAVSDGYHYVWSPPDSVRSCIENGLLLHFETGAGGLDPESRIHYARELCETKPNIAQIALSATAVLFATIALWFLLGVTGRVKKNGSQRTEHSISSDAYSLRANTGDPVSTRPREDLSPISLADLLREDLDPDLPVSAGNGKADDPLVITETRDYVSVEYAIAYHTLAMMNEEYKLKEQRVHRRGGRRRADELVFDKAVRNC